LSALVRANAAAGEEDELHSSAPISAPLIQQHQRSERTAHVTVTSGDDLIDSQLTVVPLNIGPLLKRPPTEIIEIKPFSECIAAYGDDL